MEQAAISWAQQILGDAVIVPVRSRPWSDMAEARVGGRLWWLKINKAETVYETRLLGLLSGLQNPLLPEAIVHTDQPWSLIADAGHRLDHLALSPEQQFGIWARVLPEYAELQQAVGVDRLEAIGVPDFRPRTLPDWYGRLVALFDADPSARAHLTTAELTRLTELGRWISELAAELAEGLPPTLQHDDLHEGNVLAADDHDQLTVIDWGDSIIGHPFSTLRVTLGRLQRQLELVPDHPALARLTDAYLEPWQRGGVTRKDLLRQVDVAYRIGSLNRVFANYRAFGRLEPAISPDQPADGLFWIQEMINDAALPLPRRAALPDRSAHGASAPR